MAFIRRSMKGKIITYMILWISLAHRIMCFGRVLLFSKLCFSYTKNVSLFWPFGIGNSQFCLTSEMDLCCQKLGRWLFIVVQPDNDQVICLFSTQIQIHIFDKNQCSMFYWEVKKDQKLEKNLFWSLSYCFDDVLYLSRTSIYHHRSWKIRLETINEESWKTKADDLSL